MSTTCLGMCGFGGMERQSVSSVCRFYSFAKGNVEVPNWDDDDDETPSLPLFPVHSCSIIWGINVIPIVLVAVATNEGTDLDFPAVVPKQPRVANMESKSASLNVKPMTSNWKLRGEHPVSATAGAQVHKREISIIPNWHWARHSNNPGNTNSNKRAISKGFGAASPLNSAPFPW